MLLLARFLFFSTLSLFCVLSFTQRGKQASNPPLWCAMAAAGRDESWSSLLESKSPASNNLLDEVPISVHDGMVDITSDLVEDGIEDSSRYLVGYLLAKVYCTPCFTSHWWICGNQEAILVCPLTGTSITSNSMMLNTEWRWWRLVRCTSKLSSSS